jgi:hypothetical protein
MDEANDFITFVVACFIFPRFLPKIACQDPKPSNPMKQNKIELAYSFHPNRYT